MAVAQLSAAPCPSAHPMANPGYGKKSAPDQAPRTGRDFGHLPAREASIATYLDRLDDEADISIKTLAKHLPYGQCAIGTALNNLSAAGHLRRVRRPVTVDGCPRWVWHTFFSRTARDDAWWDSFLAGKAPVTEPAPAARSAAYDALAQLGRIDARLTLSAAECGALEALALARTRHGIGDGSDLGRIGLQHTLVKALLDQISATELLTNPAKLYNVADTLTDSLTTDTGLDSLTELMNLGRSLQGLSSTDTRTLTMPVLPAPFDRNRVIADEPEAGALWESLR